LNFPSPRLSRAAYVAPASHADPAKWAFSGDGGFTEEFASVVKRGQGYRNYITKHNQYMPDAPDGSPAMAVAYAPEAAYVYAFIKASVMKGGSVADVKTVMKEMAPEFKAKVKGKVNKDSSKLFLV
jgi:hypothetical protein